MLATTIAVTGGRWASSSSKCATDGVHSVSRGLALSSIESLLTCFADAESQVEEYERILSGEIKVPVKKGYSAENRDLQLKVGRRCSQHSTKLGLTPLVLQLLTREPEDRIGAKGGAAEIQAHPFFASIDWVRLAARQVAPPFKPQTHADEDASDYHDLGRRGSWMFGDGRCWSNPSRRGSRAEGEDNEGADEGLFRDFTFTGEHAKVTRRESFKEPH